MPIDKVVILAGVGTVVVGTVEIGVRRKGEQAYLEQEDGRIDVIWDILIWKLTRKSH